MIGALLAGLLALAFSKGLEITSYVHSFSEREEVTFIPIARDSSKFITDLMEGQKNVAVSNRSDNKDSRPRCDIFVVEVAICKSRFTLRGDMMFMFWENRNPGSVVMHDLQDNLGGQGGRLATVLHNRSKCSPFLAFLALPANL